MQNIVVHLQSEVSNSFRCQKAANSLDIDTSKKSVHHLEIGVDLVKPFNVGLILGASGSGKTTLAKKLFGDDCFEVAIDLAKPIIDQFPDDWSYDDCATALAGMGLTAVPCWIRPAYTLSNGQRARAEAALLLAASTRDVIVIDEWTSVVDRTVAKVMSHCLQKYARRTGKKIMVISCHYDVVEWLNPDFISDCNLQQYTDRRAMVGTFERTDQLRLDVRQVDRKSWKYFSKYHYLSDNLPAGKIYTYGLFDGENQIGFQCFAAYIPGNQVTFFSNRTVIHPDYAGLGLGIHLINETSKDVVRKGLKVKAKFSSIPVYKAMIRQKYWICTEVSTPIEKGKMGSLKGNSGRQRVAAVRSKVKCFHFDFIWKA